jgi:hypothetical protein
VSDVEFQELLGRVLTGDTDAWSRLIDLFDPIIRVAVRGQAPSLRAIRQTDDNVQSVLLLCWQQNWPARFQGRSFREAVGYVQKASIHVLLNHIRRAKGEQDRRVDLNVAAMCADLTKPVEETVASEEEYRLVLAALKAESRDQGQYDAALRLLAGEGYAAVAKDVRMTKDALRVAFQRLLDRAGSWLLNRLEAINHG